MIRRLVKEESGITMALTVMMVVVIGVMGAGLLVFVQRDLESVVEVNQGQRALELADSGVQAARRQLSTVDAKPRNYDNNAPNGDSEWSEITAVGSGEKRLDFDGDGTNDIFVKIRFLTPSATGSETVQPDKAPEVLPAGATDADGDGYLEYPSNRRYFKVTARGETGGAVRQVQAIYRSQSFNLPVAFFATRDINVASDATSVDGVSLFAQRYITGLRPGNITGPDRRYGNWAADPITNAPNAYNSVPRATDRAGAAALGKGPSDPAPPNGVSESGITYDQPPTDNAQKAGTASPQRYGLRDVDKSSNLANVAGSKKFSTNTWSPSSQPSNTVTFPFETGNVAEDNDTIAALKARAQSQGRYIQRPSGGSFTITEGTGPENYPRNSDLGTVMFVEFASGTKGSVEYKARTASGDNLVKGTIVVVNGDLRTNNSADDFQGAFVVRDGDPTRIGGVEPVMEYRNIGSINLQGFLNVEGDIFLRGNVDGLLPGSLVSGIDGLYSLTLWSWRECYDLNCG